MLLNKTIKLEPTHWNLDVIVGTDLDQIAEYFTTRYGPPKEDHRKHAHGNWVTTMESSEESELKGENRIVLKLEDLKNKGIIIHELIHVLFHLQNKTAIEISYESQEWIAIFMERTWNELCRPNYEKIKKQ